MIYQTSGYSLASKICRALLGASCLLLLLHGVVLAQSRVVKSATLDFHDDVLGRFDEAKRATLLRHLTASARWRVRRDDGVWVANRRRVTGPLLEGQTAPQPGSLRIARGTSFGDPDDETVNVTLTLGGPVPAIEGDLVAAGAGSRAVTIVTESARIPSSTVIVEGSSNIHLEINEQSDDLKRSSTQRVLDDVNRELASVLEQADIIAGRGYGTVPAESLSSSTEGSAILTLEDGSDSGIYEAVGYLNTGEAGAVYVKAFATRDNAPLSAERIKKSSMEYVGWSKDPTTSFFFDSDITIYEGGRKARTPARFELWFVPADGSTERKLCETTREVSGWER